MPANWTANKPKIIEFYGFEGEDFRYFKSVLETFFSLTGITSDARRVNILRTQLRRSAGVYFDKHLEKNSLTVAKVTYQEAIKFLQEHYITDQLIQNYELAFNEMCQSPGESPQVFLSRLYEAADLAEIQEEKLIHSRFRAGLLPALKTFCREQSASSFDQWVRHSEGWWNAHAPQSINLVENPFVADHTKFNYPTSISSGNNNLAIDKSVRFTNERVSALKDVNSKVHKSNNKAYVGEESPTMSALAAKIEALDLHQLIPQIDSIEHTNENVIQRINPNSFKTKNDLKAFIKNIVQEVVENDLKEENTNEEYYDTRKTRPNYSNPGYFNYRNGTTYNQPIGNNSYNSNYPNNEQTQEYAQYNNNSNYGTRYNNNNDSKFNNQNHQQGSYQNNSVPAYNNYNNQNRNQQQQQPPLQKNNIMKNLQKNNTDHMDTNEENSTGPTLLTQPYPAAPTLSHKDIILPNANDIIHNIDSNGNVTKNINNNKIRAIKKVSPLSERISYDITEDVLNRKADIVVKDLLIAAPSLKRELIKSVRNKNSLVNIPPMTLAFAEDDDVDTTAIYTDVYIGQTKFKAILDTGSAKTVISRKLAEALNLTIDTPSTSVFTLGNGSRQASLGLIYDVPI
ncbi:hypothetical protein BD770DRAFT_335054, partial [Pilaira anomala]